MKTEDVSYISSRSNPTVTWASSLKEKKYRDAEESFLAEGWKLVEEAAVMELPVTHIFIAQSKRELYLPKVAELAQIYKMEKTGIFVLADACFEKISTEKAPQGIIAVIKHLDFFKRCIKIYMKDISPDARALCLCSVRDPGNLGAIIRSAVAFGTDTLILSEDCADLYNPKTVRAAMGCLFKLKAFIVQDLASAVVALAEAGRNVYAAELNEKAVSLATLDIGTKDVFMIGNEGHGIPREISALCHASVYIPIRDGVESLNASVAASVLLWEQGKKG